jgi:hypothetical protein
MYIFTHKEKNIKAIPGRVINNDFSGCLALKNKLPQL